MNVWYEYEIGLQGATLVVTVRWYLSSDPGAGPIHTDVLSMSLFDRAVTPDLLRQRVLDRAVEIRNAVATWTAVQDAFGGSQNVRIQAP